MNILEVIEIADNFLRDTTGVKAHPTFVRLAERAGKPAWWVSYSAELFFPPDSTGKCIVDGGDYVIIVDVKTGEVSVLR